jgi:hypothetical protein
LELSTGKLTEVAHRDDLGVLAFAVEGDGSLVFQRRGILVSRKNGMEWPFRSFPSEPKLDDVTAYAWTPNGELIFADRNRIHRSDANGVVTLVTQIEGKVIEPKIWNGTDIPSIFGLAVDNDGNVLAAVPGLAKVYRIGKNGTSQEVAYKENGWRPTGVAVFGNSIFLMESDLRASTSPRVRLLRSNGSVNLLSLPAREE